MSGCGTTSWWAWPGSPSSPTPSSSPSPATSYRSWSTHLTTVRQVTLALCLTHFHLSHLHDWYKVLLFEVHWLDMLTSLSLISTPRILTETTSQKKTVQRIRKFAGTWYGLKFFWKYLKYVDTPDTSTPPGWKRSTSIMRSSGRFGLPDFSL